MRLRPKIEYHGRLNCQKAQLENMSQKTVSNRHLLLPTYILTVLSHLRRHHPRLQCRSHLPLDLPKSNLPSQQAAIEKYQ